MKKLLLIAFLFPSILLSAQEPEQDCVSAIPICDSIYIQPNSYTGSGYVQNEIGTGICLGAGELNAVWYKLITTSAGDLGFNIIPNGATEDYDWAVFNLTNGTCSNLKTNPGHYDVACDYSGSVFPTSQTGPNGGINSQDEPMIPVQANRIYYICITSFSDSITGVQSGYTIDFSISTCGLDSCLVQTIVGVDETEQRVEATLFPNPASQSITLKLSNLNPAESYTLAIYNSAGALVKEEVNNKPQTTLDVSALPAGLYTYQIVTTNGKTTAGRFVKN